MRRLTANRLSMWSGILAIPPGLAWYATHFQSVLNYFPTHTRSWLPQGLLGLCVLFFVMAMIAHACASARSDHQLRELDRALGRASRTNEWTRLNEDQIEALAVELRALGTAKLCILPRVAADCEDLGDDIANAAIRAGWIDSQSIHGSYGGLAAEGVSVEPASGRGFEIRNKIATHLTLILRYPVNSTDNHPAQWDFVAETWQSRTKLGEDVVLKLGRKVNKTAK